VVLVVVVGWGGGDHLRADVLPPALTA